MITCPWCGTSYGTFQPDCPKCGGPMNPPEKVGAPAGEDTPVMPPAPPRPVSDRYAWRLLGSDGWSIAALVFLLLGGVFALVGIGLTLGIVTAIVGIPFVILGLLFLGAGGGVGYWRYQDARRTVLVLQTGQAVVGQIVSTEANYSVQVNGRNPWVIRYRFATAGGTRQGQVTTLIPPGPALQAGRRACVLFLPEAPNRNVIYPHP